MGRSFTRKAILLLLAASHPVWRAAKIFMALKDLEATMTAHFQSVAVPYKRLLSADLSNCPLSSRAGRERRHVC
eukprot:scaffold86536_cov33-Tisochrysis_lutea.AAC.2